MSAGQYASMAQGLMGGSKDDEEEERRRKEKAAEEAKKATEDDAPKKSFGQKLLGGINEFLEGAASGSNPAAYAARKRYGEGGFEQQQMDAQTLRTNVNAVNAGLYAAQQHGGLSKPAGQQAFNTTMNSLGLGHIKADTIAGLQGTGIGGGPTSDSGGTGLPPLAATTQQQQPQQPQQQTSNSQFRKVPSYRGAPSQNMQPASQNTQTLGEMLTPPVGATGADRYKEVKTGINPFNQQAEANRQKVIGPGEQAPPPEMQEALARAAKNSNARQQAVAGGAEVVDNGDGVDTTPKTMDQLGLTDANHQKHYQDLREAIGDTIPPQWVDNYFASNEGALQGLMDRVQNGKASVKDILAFLKEKYANERS